LDEKIYHIVVNVYHKIFNFFTLSIKNLSPFYT